MARTRNFKQAIFEWTYEIENYNEATDDYETQECCTEVTVIFQRDFDGWYSEITDGYYDIPECQHEKIISYAWDYADQE